MDPLSKPVCPQRAPYAVELEAGDYYWCSCGKSKNQPFCDGSHTGGDFTPKKFSLSEKTKVWLCGCKASAKKPFCDGTHKTLEGQDL